MPAIRSACLSVALLAALSPAASGAAPPPIVLVSIDTLRSDRLPSYGYRGVETPAIDALARDGVLFEHAYSHAPLTLPSHLSMLTGLLPGEHGVRDNSGYRFEAARHPYVPELLRRAGYATAGMASSYVLRAETGFSAGFERFDADVDPGTSNAMGEAQRPGRVTLDLAKRWLDEARSRPFFLFLHFYEPHTPYEPEARFQAKYADRYDGEVATADALFGELVAHLRQLDLYDRALILLVSDHGEGLGDHGEREHGLLLYRETLQVPMILKLPGGELAGRRVAAAAQLVDVAPTLLAAAGAPTPAAMKGTPLAELARSSGPLRRIFSETVAPRLHYGWSDLISVVELPYQLIDGPDPELYQIESDPRETRNLRDVERPRFHALRRAARSVATPIAPPGQEDPETAKKLAALGYLGGSARVEGPLADPKAKLPLRYEFVDAVAALEAGDATRALPTFRKVVADTPGMTEGWIQLGSTLQRLGQTDEALAAFQRALQIAPGSTSAALGAANLLRELGRHDEARRHAELALGVAPVEAQTMLATIALAGLDFGSSERAARAALAAGGGQLEPLLLLARAMVGQKRASEALEILEQAERRIPALPPGSRDYRGLYVARGDAYLVLDRPRDAFSAYQLEVDTFPDSPAGYISLAFLFQTAGRPRDAARFPALFVEKNPTDPTAYRIAVLTLQKLGDKNGAQRLLAQGRARFPADAALKALTLD